MLRFVEQWEACMATVAEHKAANIHVKDGISREEFIAARDARDATLALPDRMLCALRINIRGGRLPEPDVKGRAVRNWRKRLIARPRLQQPSKVRAGMCGFRWMTDPR